MALKLIELDPKSEIAKFSAAQAASSLNMFQEAERIFRSFERPDASYIENLGYVHHLLPLFNYPPFQEFVKPRQVPE